MGDDGARRRGRGGTGRTAAESRGRPDRTPGRDRDAPRAGRDRAARDGGFTGERRGRAGDTEGRLPRERGGGRGPRAPRDDDREPRVQSTDRTGGPRREGTPRREGAPGPDRRERAERERPYRPGRADRGRADRGRAERGRPDRVGRPDRPARAARPDRARRRGEQAPARQRAAEPAARAVRPPEGPPLPEGLDPRSLDREVRDQLRSLARGVAEQVALRLVATGELIDVDPETALAHAQVARRLASRVAAVREATGLAAYRAGDWTTAIRELRTYHRMTGRQSHLAVIADCERALGRPERAIDIFRTADRSQLSEAEAAELLIVAAGARADLGQREAAVAMLQVPQLAATEPWAARLRYAYADALLGVGRVAEAREWFARAAEIDPEASTDAAERLLELDGVVLEDDESGDEDADAGGDATTNDGEPAGGEPMSDVEGAVAYDDDDDLQDLDDVGDDDLDDDLAELDEDDDLDDLDDDLADDDLDDEDFDDDDNLRDVGDDDFGEDDLDDDDLDDADLDNDDLDDDDLEDDFGDDEDDDEYGDDEDLGDDEEKAR